MGGKSTFIRQIGVIVLMAQVSTVAPPDDLLFNILTVASSVFAVRSVASYPVRPPPFLLWTAFWPVSEQVTAS